jgi:HD superfamily phosphohydrolase
MREAMLALLRNTEYVKILSEKHVIIGLISALLSSLVYYPYSYIVTEIKEQEPELFKELAPRMVFRKLMDVKSDIAGKSLLEYIHDLFGDYQINIGSLEYVIFGKNGTSNNELDMLNAILNSSVGVRVIDYSMRDSHHIGLAYEMNLNDLFMSMSIARGEFCLGQSGITSAEQIISNRYWLFKRIYWNNPNRANASLLKHLFFSVCDGQFASELIDLIPTATNDNVLQLVLKHSGKQKAAFSQSIKLIQRKGQVRYKCVLALDKASSLPHASYICWRFADLNYSDQHRIRDTIEEELIKFCKLEPSITDGGPLILIDMPFEKKGTKLGNDIRVERHDNSYLELSKASGIISGLNQSFQDQLMLVRVYIRPDIFYLCKEKEEHVKMIEFLNYQLYDLL